MHRLGGHAEVDSHLLPGDYVEAKANGQRSVVHDHLDASVFLRDRFQAVERKRQIISMQMPPLPDQWRFYSALLFEIGAPHSPKAGVSGWSSIRAPT